MNKSKFLKRSLAALLAILLVAAMIPMSALAADDDTTTEPAAPAYTVVVNNREAAFEDGGFKATVYSTYILSVALYGLPEGVKVDLVTKNQNVVPLTSTTAVDLKQEATLVSETERTSLYNITLRETKGTDTPQDYTLAVTVENAVPVDNVDIKAVRAEMGSIIDSVIGKDTVTLILPLGDDKTDVKNEAGGSMDDSVFVPANFDASADYSSSNETVTITAADGSSKTYKVIFAHETGFETFTVPKQIGDTDVSDDGLTYSITVPKGTELNKITPTWTYGENVIGIYSDGTEATGPKAPDSALGSANNFPGVRSGRGWYNFDAETNADGSNIITFFVVTKATNEQNKSAAVNVKVTETSDYVGTGIKNFTVIVNKGADDIPLATNYKVTANNTVYMPAGYNFGKDDTIDLAIELDTGATATIISQNDPKLPSSSTYFSGIKTNGHQFTIQVKAQDDAIAPVNYRVNLVAAPRDAAELSNNSGLRFQIGGDDGKSMAATFDRDSQTNMTIKVPYDMMSVTPGGTTTTAEVVTSDLEENIIEKVILNGSDCISRIENYDSLDKTKIAEAIKEYNSDPSHTPIANDSELGIKFSGNKTDKLVELVAGDTVIATGTTSADDATVENVEVSFGELGSITISLGNYNTVNNVDTAKTNLSWGRLFENNDGWEDFTQNDLTTKASAFPGPGYCIALAGMKYTEETVTTPAGTTPVPTSTLRDKKVYALVSPGASAYWCEWDASANNGDGGWVYDPDYNANTIENSVTTFGEIWDEHIVVNGVCYFRIHVHQNGISRDYNIKLEQEDPRDGAKITDPATIGTTDVIGEMDELTGTPVERSGNTSLLKVGVGFDWTDSDYTTYIYNGLKISDGAKAFIENTDGTGLVDVTPDADADMTNNGGKEFGSLTNKQIMPQSSNVEGLTVDADNDIVSKDKSPVVTSLSEKIYVFSEAEYAKLKEDGHEGLLTTATTDNDLKTLETYAHIYNVYYERGTANNQALLQSISSSTPGVTANLDYTKTVNVRVPNSFNWTKYRDNDTCDFTLEFTVSDGAKLYDAVVNPWASGKTTFFVKDGEMWTYDKLTGIWNKITLRGTESQSAELRVTSQDGSVTNTYPMTLTIAPPSSNANLSKVVVGETEATIGSNGEVTVTLPAGSELAAQDVFITPASAVATVQNADGEAFDSTVKHDLSEPMKFTITAEDGTKAEYTLTAKVGGSVVDPDKKPSESYTDLDKVYSGLLEKVKAAIDMGLMGSTSTTAFVFAPKADVHRKDVAVIIARADLIASNDTIVDSKQADEALKAMYTDGEDAFDDLSKCNDIQKAAIRYCAEKEIIGGDGKGSFNPDGELKREEMAIILTNWTDITVDKNNTTNDEIADWNNVSNWAKPYVNAVYGKMMNGVGNSNFGPKVTVSREQTASMLVDAFGILYPGYGH